MGSRAIEAAIITTERLVLVPLQAEDADELCDVLHDDRRPELLDHVVGAWRRLHASGAAREVVALRPGGGDRVGLGRQLVHDDEPLVRA